MCSRYITITLYEPSTQSFLIRYLIFKMADGTKLWKYAKHVCKKNCGFLCAICYFYFLSFIIALFFNSIWFYFSFPLHTMLHLNNFYGHITIYYSFTLPTQIHATCTNTHTPHEIYFLWLVYFFISYFAVFLLCVFFFSSLSSWWCIRPIFEEKKKKKNVNKIKICILSPHKI